MPDWTKELTFLPTNDWTASEPTDKEFFRIRSLNPPRAGKFLIAEIEFNEFNVSLQSIQEVPATADYIVLRIPKSPVLTNRRIGIIQVEDYRVSNWGIELWSSDYISSPDGNGGGGEEEPEPETPTFAPGAEFWIEGDYIDLSGNERDLLPSVENQLPLKTTGVDGCSVLRWTGSSTGQLFTAPFLNDASAITCFAVFTRTANSSHYNLLKTLGLDDYWLFSQNNAGYIGTFRNGRAYEYPSAMPTSGTHLVVIVSTPSQYEVFIDGVSAGALPGSFNPGDRFIVVPNDRPFSGDLVALGVYDRILTSDELKQNLTYLKTKVPSLPFTLPT